jgi:hypothetical protein
LTFKWEIAKNKLRQKVDGTIIVLQEVLLFDTTRAAYKTKKKKEVKHRQQGDLISLLLLF